VQAADTGAALIGAFCQTAFARFSPQGCLPSKALIGLEHVAHIMRLASLFLAGRRSLFWLPPNPLPVGWGAEQSPELGFCLRNSARLHISAPYDAINCFPIFTIWVRDARFMVPPRASNGAAWSAAYGFILDNGFYRDLAREEGARIPVCQGRRWFKQRVATGPVFPPVPAGAYSRVVRRSIRGFQSSMGGEKEAYERRPRLP
jgi:hypothetical protein